MLLSKWLPNPDKEQEMAGTYGSLDLCNLCLSFGMHCDFSEAFSQLLRRTWPEWTDPLEGAAALLNVILGMAQIDEDCAFGW